MCRHPAQKLPVPQLPDELAVASLDFTTNGDDTRAPLDSQALEGAVVDVHQLGLGRDLTSVVGVVNH